MIPIYRMLYSRTPKIKDAKGNAKTNSIASLEKVQINDVKQQVLIRGHDLANPILLFVHGGPGTPETAIAYKIERPLEEHFTVVNWDQRGAGRSYSRSIPPETMTIEQFIEDCISLVKLLRKRFNKEKIYLLGHSWGSILGLYVVQRRPEYFHAYIGLGQVANLVQNEQISFNFVYSKAKEINDKKSIKALEKIMPYTGRDEKSVGIQRKILDKYKGTVHNLKGFSEMIKYGFGSPEYNIFDFIRFLRGEAFSMKYMWASVFEVDLFTEVTEIKVPMYICQGRHDYQTPFELAEKLMEMIKAPQKKFIWFEKSAHAPNLEEPEAFNDALINIILPETYRAK